MQVWVYGKFWSIKGGIWFRPWGTDQMFEWLWFAIGRYNVSDRFPRPQAGKHIVNWVMSSTSIKQEKMAHKEMQCYSKRWIAD